MDASFWHQRWQENEIGFHQSEADSKLVKYFDALSLVEGSRVFVPLCGKTLDIAWLLSKGYRVAGAELSEMAIQQLFVGLGVEPNISNEGNLKRYSAHNIDIFVADIFEVNSELLGQIDAVYDRAALVALPADMRVRYTAHLMDITHNAPQLLLCFDYDQSVMEGPPFSISAEEVGQHYRNDYGLDLLDRADVPDGLKGQCAAKENVWLLLKK